MSDATLRPLIAVLERRGFGLADWGARATDGTASWRRLDGDGVRNGSQQLHRYRAIVHRDVAAGRGSATIDVDAGPSAPLTEVVSDAVERALATIGPAWKSPPPAAPARVAIDDPELATGRGDVTEPLTRMIRAAAATAGAELLTLELELIRQTISLATSRGLDATWTETEVGVRLDLIRSGHRATVRRRVRRAADLGLDAAIPAALAAAARADAAAPTPSGPMTIVLEADALLHDGVGLLGAFVGQADPGLERQGLGAARLGRPIVDGAAAAAEPLSLISDGTLPFGLASTPIADLGDPVRRFTLIERGVVRGLALDGREAALRGVQPNGGVRGLVVPAGASDADALLAGPGPTLVIEALHWLELEPVTGRFRARIALGRIVGDGAPRDVRGGLIRGDALAALALARRSRELIATPSYRGPTRWALGPLTVEPS